MSIFGAGVDRRLDDAVRSTTRTRRIAAAAIFASGLMTVVSAITPGISSRMRVLASAIPLGVHQAVFALTAVVGAGLIVLSGGVRRGQFRAWAAAVGLLVVSALGHLAKGLDVEEAVVSLALAAWLVIVRRRFRAPGLPAGDVWRGRLAAVLALAAALATAAAGVTLRREGLGYWRALHAVVDRLANDRSIPIGGRLDSLLSAALTALGASLLVAVLWAVLRPARHGSAPATSKAVARRIVAAHGDDTLAYFALRDDKERWVFGDTLITFAVLNGACLVSPDPVGPAAEVIDAWGAFAQYVSDHGWALAVLGANDDWREIYAAFGMRAMYIGDEAVVDVGEFTLDGSEMKAARQATNRIANHGYTISFHDPATIDPGLAGELRLLMAESRRGAVERGFSMTLSRVFDPDDRGLLLAVCHDAAGAPAAFCQFVPAGSHGYSLDLMRRSTAEHPNGLTDFVLVRTIEHLRDDTSCTTLSLNFATMRAVLAGERTGVGQSIQRSMLGWMSESMQIESLWKYTAKFHPRWLPRYLVYDTAEHLATIGIAVARAESFWDLPVVGGLFVPAARAEAVP